MATKIKSGVIGTLDSNLVFADNSKAVFGAGSDLQIYHNGSNSFIADVGTGVLDIQTNGTEIQMTKAGAELMAKFVPDGAVTLYYDHSPKLATTSTGIDVTGTVVSTSNTATQFKNATDTDIQHKFETNSSSDFAIHRLIGSDGVDNKFIIGYGPNHPSTPNHIALKNTHASGSLGFNTGAASIERMRIDSSGRLLIGGTSATFGVLGVESSGNCTADFFSNSGSSTAAKTELFFSGGISGNSHVSFASIVAEQAAGNEATRKGQLRFLTANSGGPQTAMTIIANGNVGIAQPSPATTLHIGDGASHYVRIENAGSGDVSSGYQIYRGSSVGMSLYDNPADNMTSLLCAGGLNINAGGSGADLHVASNGKVGIGTTQPGERLHVEGSMMLDAYNVGAEEGLFFREGFSSSNRYNMGIMSYAHNGSTLDGITIGAYNGFSVCTGSNSRQERMRINDNGTLMIGSSTNPSFPHKLYASGNAITNGTAFFEDTDVSCGLANVVLKLSFSNDADCTNASFIYMTDSNNVLGSVGAASGTSVNFSSSSDERLKENIVDASSQLDVINNIQVREFDWKSNSHHELGLIAQEINTTIPNVVREGGDNVAEHPWSVDYGKLTPYIIKAFQEQQTIIEDLKSRIETLEG